MAVTLIERLPSHFELKIHFPSQCNGTAKNSLFGRAEKIWMGVVPLCLVKNGRVYTVNELTKHVEMIIQEEKK